MKKIEVPIKEVKGLVLRECIASATIGKDEYDISLSMGCVIFEFPDGRKYGVLLSDILKGIVKSEKESILDTILKEDKEEDLYDNFRL